MILNFLILILFSGLLTFEKFAFKRMVSGKGIQEISSWIMIVQDYDRKSKKVDYILHTIYIVYRWLTSEDNNITLNILVGR